MNFNAEEIATFLKESNKSTYANKAAPKVDSLRPGSYDYHFEKGSLAYHDTYFGGRDFMGEEIIYKSGIPVWGANYYGFIMDESISESMVYDFLRTALMRENQNMLPIRGPEEFVNDNLRYSNNIDGDLKRFSGTEEISIDSEVVYRCWYHGGKVV